MIKRRLAMLLMALGAVTAYLNNDVACFEYLVKSGDSCWTLENYYGTKDVTVSGTHAACGSLQVGEKLSICGCTQHCQPAAPTPPPSPDPGPSPPSPVPPPSPAPPAPPSPTPPSPTPPSPAPGCILCTVKSGDSCWALENYYDTKNITDAVTHAPCGTLAVGEKLEVCGCTQHCSECPAMGPTPAPTPPAPTPPPTPRSLPDKVIVAYTGAVGDITSPSSSTCSQTLMASVKSGVNVLIWSFVQMGQAGQAPAFTSNLNPQCVKDMQQQTKAAEASIGRTVHLVSVGGWGAPHPTLLFNASEWLAEWEQFNARNGFRFDGLDWDVEGVNDVTSSDNTIPVPMLELMADVTQQLQKAGYLVTMAPPESYLDPVIGSLADGNDGFDTSLLHPYPEWESATPPQTFSYHGLNSYAYMFARNPTLQLDLVMPQVYETWSHASFSITQASPPVPASRYLDSLVRKFEQGWTVDFSACTKCTGPDGKTLSKVKLAVPAKRLAVGLSNGWADGKKSLFIAPSDVGLAYAAGNSSAPRGYMFWDLGHEGLVPKADSSGTPLYMATELNKFMHTRE